MRTTHDTRRATRGGQSPFLPSFLRSQGGRKNRFAFTLIEMIIVISIISVLLGLLYGALERAKKFSRRTITFSELKSVESAFKQYYAHYHAWPSNGMANADARIQSGEDLGFVIDKNIAKALQGFFETETYRALNPEAIPFIEFSRYSPGTGAPVNPFKSEKSTTTDTSRAYKVLFDTDGDRQIFIPGNDPDAAGSTDATNIIASVAVWTLIPATRKTDTSGQPQQVGDVLFGSWESFSVK